MSRRVFICFWSLFAVALHATAQLDSLLAPIAVAAVEKPAGNTPAAVQASPNVDPPSAPRVLSGDDILRDLSKQLAAHFSLTGELQLALTRPWQPTKLPAAEYALRITQWPAQGVDSSFAVQIKIESAGRVVLEGQLPLRAQLFQEVWTASERLERGQALDRARLVACKVDVLREREALVPSDTEPAGLELTASIPAGRALARRDVIERPVIRKGQVVEVVAQSGLLAVTTKALALESGTAGGLIKMRNLESRKDFNAQVINDSKVQVHF